ncbi:MAG: protein-export chaperone SecB [Rhodospirillaceae bacterium]|nr:protein-export chaperone SecB [Rhodospirillaceae bacterium]|tara:strand:+ start:11982 stop:12494 length:513 start_codon:yes stop_codon:yes gene_type:complete
MADVPPEASEDDALIEDIDEEMIQPQIGIENQYIKDLSFENPVGPNAPQIVGQSPEVGVEVTTSARALEDGMYEVTLVIRGEAKTPETTVFIVELTYAGVLTIADVPEDAIGPILLIEGARLLFPFARNIVADVSRDGGFPPLFINPIDFVQLYREQHLDEGAANGAGTA